VVNAQTGEVAQRIDYDEFGRITQNTNPGFQPFGFGGGLYDEDTQLTHFGAREYDAFAGRWTSQDPAGFVSGNNLHAYAGNDPVNFGDPSGLAPCDCSQKLLTGLDADLVAGRDYTVKDGVHPYFAPDFAAELSARIRVLNSEGIIPQINDAYRTQNEQLLQFNTQKPGLACDPISGAEVCKHQLGYSVDIDLSDVDAKTGETVWNRNWLEIVAQVWGGNIKWGGFFNKPDWVHFYSDPGGADVQARRDRAKQVEDYFTTCIPK
jgi:RHS repeat-associated protein